MAIAVLGLGLIGGSLARDLAGAGHRILGYDTDPATLAAAVRARVVASALDDSLAGLAAADVVVLAAPVDAAPALLERVVPHVAGARLISDVGSTKHVVQNAAVGLGLAERFIGAHPLAGEQRSGWAVGRAGLFEGTTVYLCPAPGSARDALRLAQGLWRSVGARPAILDAHEHDRLLAWTSHMPQTLSTALALAYRERGIAVDDLGPGGRGMVRLAASSPAMWAAIALTNRDPLRESIDRIGLQLRRLSSALEAGQADVVREMFETGRRWTGSPGGAAAMARPLLSAAVNAHDASARAGPGRHGAPRAAFQGERGAFSEEAVLAFFGREVQPLGCVRVADVAGAVAEGDVAFGVLPIENTVAGSIVETCDRILEHELSIVGEVVIPVMHCLLGIPGARLDTIRRVVSHPVALAQCTRFLAGHPSVEAVARPDTAGAAREIAAAGMAEVAAIASRRAAELYGLVVLLEDIQDRRDNQTRFVVVATADGASRLSPPPSTPGGRRKTTLVIETPNVPGALLRVLRPFADRSINLARLESRPTGEPWTYRFFMEVEAGAEEPGMTTALAEAAAAGSLRVLGSYSSRGLS